MMDDNIMILRDQLIGVGLYIGVWWLAILLGMGVQKCICPRNALDMYGGIDDDEEDSEKIESHPAQKRSVD